MSLTPGTRLGPYEVTTLIGSGGMGEVYRAHDAKLNRDVALKVLPDSFASDADRLARFTREAHTLAALNHPNIAQIHGFEESGGVRALVMELVEGDDLSQRIARGAIPLDEALPIARQIAEALEAAHEKGIVHRDLKPANIKVRADGTVKVLDFGLAKAMDAPSVTMADPSLSPTLTSPAHLRQGYGGQAMTEAGMILGTAAYMAPEQARGKIVDKRADIWAFGCVLYEMLTARRAFDGESVADVLAAVMVREPDLSALSVRGPDAITALIRRCLQKDPRRRLRDIGDAVHELESVSDSHDPVQRAQQTPVTSSPSSRSALPWIVAALGVLFGVTTLFWNRVPTPPQRSALVQVDARVGSDASLVTDQGPAAVLSPDGSMLAFVARKPGQSRQLYVRRLDQLAATALPGTDDARVPFFSPNGQWVAFFGAGTLKKVPVSGGAPVVLCDAPNGRGGSWGDDDRIVFTPTASGDTSLRWVSAAGGTSQPLTTLREGEATQRWPQVLPGSKALIYSASTNLGNYNDGEIVLQPLPTGEPRVIYKGGFFGRYLRSGHLTFVHDGRLFVVPFDLSRLEVVGSPVPVLENVSRLVATGAAQFDVSDSGTAVYVSGDTGSAQPLSWLARGGAITPLAMPPADWSNPRFSPDGQRLAVDVFDGKQTDLWIYDWKQGARTQLTFDPAEDWMPLWTPDGSRLTYRSARGRFAFNIFWQRADGTGAADRLTESRNPQFPTSWDSTGRVLAYTENDPSTNNDIMLLPIGEGASASASSQPYLKSAHSELSPAISPDGKWMTYVANDSGRYGIYVRPYPGPGGQRLVAEEGSEPTWSRARHELVYMGPDQRLMVAAYSANGDAFRSEPPRPWASARAVVRPRGLAGFDGRGFDLHPDGERVIGAWRAESDQLPPQDSVVIAFNFFDELRRLAPLKH